MKSSLLVCLFISLTITFVNCKVTVVIDEADIKVTDKDQTTSSEPVTLKPPSSLATPLEADQHQKLIFRFAVKDTATKQPIKVHQAFVQFTNQVTKKEVTLIAEPGTNSLYRLDLPVATSASNFAHSSGTYDINLLIGDASITNPLIWKIGSIKLTFPRVEVTGKSVPSWMKMTYDPLPVINHIFRQPEKRPPAIVSDAFTVLAGVPFLLLIGLWIKLGVNLSNFSFSLSSLGFHTGLTLIFAIFAFFWTSMNMFTTLKCLSGVVLLTFLSGHSLLKGLSVKRGN